MTTSQDFESYLPLYDVIPEDWNQARAILVEYFKKVSNAVNVREIGWWLEEELISGKQFFPGAGTPNGQYRTVLRKVIDCSPLAIGANTFAHGLTVDSSFSLVQMYVGATNSGTLVAEPIPNGSDTLSMDATNVIINVAAVWDRAYCTIEYILEL